MLLVLAVPASAATTDWRGSGEGPPVQATVAAAVDGDGGAGALHEVLPGGRLPFAPPDLAVLVLGGLVVTLAAAAAPLLLRPPAMARQDLRPRQTARVHV